MSLRRRMFRATRARRGIQIAALVLFFGLVLWAKVRPGSDPGGALGLFFLIDPLIFVTTWLTTHTVLVAALGSLGVLVVTVVLGRVFCGWFCPLGTLHDAAGRCFDWLHRDPKRREHWSPWQRGKYYALVGFLVMAAIGGHWVCIFDPLVLLYRTATVALLPATQWAVEDGATAIYKADPGIGPVRVTAASEPAYRFFRDHVFSVPKQAFLGGGLILALFLGLLLLNGYRRRFWCRYVCPLGALLGFFAWRPWLRRTVEAERCNQCDLCAMSCHGAAAAAPGDDWKAPECLGCLNCTESCSRAALGFRWIWPWRRGSGETSVDLSKRALLGSAVGGVVGLAVMRISPEARGVRYNPRLIRPPGARAEREFLKRCTSCGMCMKICPTGGLQPTLVEAGLEGLWTPRLAPTIGYCDYDCNLCGQVCPTEAIEPLTVEAKQRVHIGLATFDTTRCIPYAYGRDCMVCEEHCPIPTKAIYSLEVEIRDRDGNVKTVRQPHVDPELCIGCGICENVCPFRDRPAIRVTSANETRHGDNQPVLPGSDPYG
jgi:polyferredoxin/ferredoxin